MHWVEEGELTMPTFYHLPLVLGTSTTVGYNDVKSVIDAVTAQVSVSSIVGVLASVIGVVIGIVFAWWAIRKAMQMIFSAFRKGRANA